MSTSVRLESIDFLHFCLHKIATAAGMSSCHAGHIADAIVFAHRQGKLNQGLGVYEAIDIALEAGVLDPVAIPECVDEGPAYAVFDGQQSSGYYTLSLMAAAAIEKARSSGIAIAFGANHNDAGSFAHYVHMAYEQDMVGIASNNTVPLAAAYGGMENQLSCPPFDAIIPSGDEPPIWASLKFAEWYDADISEAVQEQKSMKGQWLIDPVTGALSDDPTPYAKPLEGYGRVWDASCAGQIETPRTYALNLWNEGMCAVINPLGKTSVELPTIDDFAKGVAAPSVGGSYFMAIDPSRFGPIAAVKERSDHFIRTVKNTRPRPDHRIRIPGEMAYESIKNDETQVQVMESHWQAFFNTIATKYELSESLLREEYGND